jgi:hypothetical protein
MEVLLNFKKEGTTEVMVYNALLRNRAKVCGFSVDENHPDTLAQARLACLCQVSSPAKFSAHIYDAWKSLDDSDRQKLTKYLTTDGINQKPGYVLVGAPAFFERACDNAEVGMLPALRIMLRVYEATAKEFQGTSQSCIYVELGKLSDFAEGFFGSVAFQDLPFDVMAKSEEEAAVIPKAWIPVSNPAVLEDMRKSGLELSNDILQKKISEDTFRKRLPRVFPEVGYFTSSSSLQQNYDKLRDHTLCSMMCVYWLITGKHDAFIRSQAQEGRLSGASWEWIQDWMRDVVKIFQPDAIDAMLVFMAIHALGRITEFRTELAKGFDVHYHDLALAHVLESKPEVVPSFARLQPKYQKLISDSLSVDFSFHQFLRAENLPLNLVVLKDKLQPHGDEGFAFFCFRIFTQMCGKHGHESSLGSLFMTEPEFQRFRPGLDALQQLRTLDAEEAYQAFLRFRGSKALSRFASREHQALARILCLGAAFDYQGGDALCDAFDSLAPTQQAALTRWLTSDGINARPGYILCHVPGVLEHAKALDKDNERVGLKAAFEMMLRVQAMFEASVSSKVVKVVVHFDEMAAWAKDASDVEEFTKGVVSYRSESHTSTEVFTIQVERPEGGVGSSGSSRGLENPCRWRCLYFVLFFSFLIAIAFLACDHLHPKLTVQLEHRAHLHVSQSMARYVFSSVAGISLFLLVAMSCYYRCIRQASSDIRDAKRVPGEVAPTGPSSEPLLSRARRGYVRLDQTPDNDIV